MSDRKRPKERRGKYAPLGRWVAVNPQVLEQKREQGREVERERDRSLNHVHRHQQSAEFNDQPNEQEAALSVWSIYHPQLHHTSCREERTCLTNPNQKTSYWALSSGSFPPEVWRSDRWVKRRVCSFQEENGRKKWRFAGGGGGEVREKD